MLEISTRAIPERRRCLDWGSMTVAPSSLYRVPAGQDRFLGSVDLRLATRLLEKEIERCRYSVVIKAAPSPGAL